MTEKKNEYQKALDWLNAKIGNRERAAVAEKLGAPTSTFNRVLSGGSAPSADKMLNWLKAFGAQLTYPDERLASYSLIPKVAAVAGAGASLETSDEVQGMYAFRTDFLTREQVNPHKSVMLLVRGDSMEPLIRDGDTILIDRSDNEPRDGFIYLITLGEELMVKRLQRLPNGWRLRSENPDKGYIDVEGDELDMFRVHGAVRWFGRVLPSGRRRINS